MVAELGLYLLSSIGVGSLWPILWYEWGYSTQVTISILFALDVVVAIEAAFYSNIVLIAVLHVITIPSFFALIYVDLVRQQNSEFRCFLCGKLIEQGEEITVIGRHAKGRKKKVSVHQKCVIIDQKDRKSFSKGKFKNGIPK